MDTANCSKVALWISTNRCRDHVSYLCSLYFPIEGTCSAWQICNLAWLYYMFYATYGFWNNLGERRNTGQRIVGLALQYYVKPTGLMIFSLMKSSSFIGFIWPLIVSRIAFREVTLNVSASCTPKEFFLLYVISVQKSYLQVSMS